MLRMTMLVISFSLLLGCVHQTEPKRKPEVSVASFLYQLNALKVKNGMSEAEVISIMGDRPSSRSEMEMPQGTVKALGWTHYNAATGKAYAVYFNFVDDKLNGRSESTL